MCIAIKSETDTWTLILDGCRFQVRYGQHWAPVHPDEPVSGILTEILLTSGEEFIHLNARAVAVIGLMEFITNLQSYTIEGVSGDDYNKFVPLNGLLYFSGAAGNYEGIRVSRLVAHRATCESTTPWISFQITAGVKYRSHLPVSLPYIKQKH